MSVAWEVSATSGMRGCDVNESFLRDLNNEEIEYFRTEIYKTIRMIRRETDRIHKEVENG